MLDVTAVIIIVHDAICSSIHTASNFLFESYFFLNGLCLICFLFMEEREKIMRSKPSHPSLIHLLLLAVIEVVTAECR
jgi:hypothetical protein